MHATGSWAWRSPTEIAGDSPSGSVLLFSPRIPHSPRSEIYWGSLLLPLACSRLLCTHRPRKQTRSAFTRATEEVRDPLGFVRHSRPVSQVQAPSGGPPAYNSTSPALHLHPTYIILASTFPARFFFPSAALPVRSTPPCRQFAGAPLTHRLVGKASLLTGPPEAG